MGNSDQLFEELFKRDLSAEDTTDFLTTVAKEHPYFTAANFFLLQKLPAGNNNYIKQAARTAVLFNNPLWLSFQLGQFDASMASGANLNGKEITTTKYDTTIDELETLVPTKENGEIIIGQQAMPATEALLEDTPKIVNEPLPIEADNTGDNAVIKHQPAVEEVPLIKTEIGTEELPANNEEAVVIYQPWEIVVSTNKIMEAPAPLSSVEEQINDTDSVDGYDDGSDDNEGNEKEMAPMNIKLNFTQEMSTTEDTISFEPLHTSDYFASLGIKLDENGKPVDKLGRQLKSFTDWLKTMKKIHSEQLPSSSEQTDNIIQKLAEKSNTEAEVLTEAMAEVLFHQGKARKAIEVYKKLSLLDPSKSAYFAAKIGDIEI